MSNKYSAPCGVNNVKRPGSKRVREQISANEGGETNHMERVGNVCKNAVRIICLRFIC